jgi:hypothetical protein
MKDEEMAYAARFPGMPGFGAVCVDKPEYAKATAKDIAGWIRRGASVERVSVEAARMGMTEYLDARRAKNKTPNAK